MYFVSSVCLRVLLCHTSFQRTYLLFHDQPLVVSVCTDSFLRLSNLSVSGQDLLVSICAQESVSQYIPAVVVAVSRTLALPLGVSRRPSLFCSPVGDGPVPVSFLADFSVLNQSSFPGGSAVESPVDIEQVAVAPLHSWKVTGVTSGKTPARFPWRVVNDFI